MGGRGSRSAVSVNYKPYKRGQITKMEAGTLYRAVKEKNVTALPETVSLMYDQTNQSIKMATSRYNADSRFYDSVEDITRNILNKQYKKAQKLINDFEKKQNELAGKKSRYAKYKK